MTSTQSTKRVEVVKGGITIDKDPYVNDYQKPKSKTAQLRQVVTTSSFYPSKKTSSDLSGNLFSNKDFGYEEQQFDSVETRMAWILVPENATKEQIIKLLDAAMEKGAVIYKVISNAPILDENQKYAVTAGIRTKDQFAATQVVRYPENEKTIADGTAGKLILDNGKVIYRKTFFWPTAHADVDLRGHEDHKPYMSPEIEDEFKLTVANVQGAAFSLEGQTV